MRIASAGPGPGPNRTGLVALVLAAVAFLATGAPIPTLEASAVGEVELGPGRVVDHPVRVHLEPGAADGATRSSLRIGFRSGSGLDLGYSAVATATLTGQGAPAPASELGGISLPLDDCVPGCDLDYVAHFEAGPTVLPGSIARYQVDLLIEYGGGSGSRPSSLASVELAGPASGPPPTAWSLVTALLGLAAGWWFAPRTDAALGGRRRWPAIALAAMPIVVLVVLGIQRLAVLAPTELAVRNALFYVVEPWSLILSGTLAWGVARGVRRWDGDGGWALGLGAVATAGLGGLWLAWWTTLEPVGQPLVAAVVAGLLGVLAGTVVGQGWRVDPRAAHDRVAAGAAVVSHGIIIAGFGFLTAASLYDPFGGGQGFLALVPAILVAVALRRWFAGGRAWLILFDLLIAGVGLVGWSLVVPTDGGSLVTLGREAIGRVAVTIAVGAAVVAVITAFHQMPRPVSPAAVDPTADADSAVSPPAAPAASPPTS